MLKIQAEKLLCLYFFTHANYKQKIKNVKSSQLKFEYFDSMLVLNNIFVFIFLWGNYMGRIISFLKPYRFAMYIAWTLMLTELTVELLQPLFMGKIIDEGIMTKDLDAIIHWSLIMLGISLLSFIAGITNSFFSAHVSQSFGYDVRLRLFKKIQAFSFHNLAQFQTSSLITRLTNDVSQMQNTVFMILRIAMRAPLLVIGGMIMALFVSPKLALYLIIPVPFLIIMLVWMMKKSGGLFKKVQEKLDAVNRILQENLSNIRLIRAFVRRKHENTRFLQANEQLKTETMTALRLVEVVSPTLVFIMNLGIIAILWFGASDVHSNQVKVGEIVAIVNYGFRITAALSMLTWIIMGLSRAKASADRVTEVLDTPIDQLDKGVRNTKSTLQGEIEFQQVDFTYPESNRKVLSNLSFHIHPGEMVAVLGATGAGKTTLLQLIPRLYEVSKGNILMDGRDIRSIEVEQLRKQIGYVPQESILFSGTVEENLKWGKEEATFEEMKQCAIDAQIHDTIMKLPNQYQTRIGQKGINLSGGQKQRLSIARALIRKPKILMLDDSTSALDLKTESKLLRALNRYECTIFIITQKISTAKKAQQILLMDDGELIGIGDHDHLLEQSDLYAKINQSQSIEEVENGH